MTVAELAHRMGVDVRTVNRWQRAERGLSVERLGDLARVLDKAPSYFLGDDAEEAVA